MFRLIHASLATVVIAYFISLGAATSADQAAPRPHRNTASRPGATLPFTATAYCQQGVTQSGVDTHTGILAADPAQLPVGSVVHVETDNSTYNGIYTVLDTGSKVQGHKVDLFIRDCAEAQQFGTKQARVTVLRKGWSPKATAPKVALPGK